MNKRRLFGAFASVALALLAVGSWPVIVRAESVRIQPAILEERIDPGSSLERTLRITNLDPSAQTFYLSVRDVESVDENGKPTFSQSPNSLYGLAGWVSTEVRQTTIPAGQTKEVKIIITAPKDAAPGGHFGGVFVSRQALRPSETGMGVGYEVGTILSLRVAGEVNESARIREFRTDKAVYDKLPATFTVKVENLGNVLVRPRGPIQVTDMFGRQNKDSLILNEEGAGIYPKTERSFAAGWTTNDPLAFGRYQATVALVYGDDRKDTITASVSFWVLPAKPILGILAGLIALLVILAFGVRFYVRKKIQQAGGAAVSATMPQSRLLAATMSAVVLVLALLFLVFFLFG